MDRDTYDENNPDAWLAAKAVGSISSAAAVYLAIARSSQPVRQSGRMPSPSQGVVFTVAVPININTPYLTGLHCSVCYTSCGVLVLPAEGDDFSSYRLVSMRLPEIHVSTWRLEQ